MLHAVRCAPGCRKAALTLSCFQPAGWKQLSVLSVHEGLADWQEEVDWTRSRLKQVDAQLC